MYITPIIPGEHRYPTITPFTIADGQTYLNTLEHLVRMMKDIIDNVNDSNEELYTLVVGVLNTKINEINDALDNQETSVDEKISQLETSVSTDIDNLTEYVNTSVSDLQASVNTNIDNLTTYVDDSVASIIDSSVEVQDPVVASLISDPASATHVELQTYVGENVELYPPETWEDRAGVSMVERAQYPYGDLRRYGAVCDGVTDDSAAVQAAFDVCGLAGRPIIKPNLPVLIEAPIALQHMDTHNYIFEGVDVRTGESRSLIVRAPYAFVGVRFYESTPMFTQVSLTMRGIVVHCSQSLDVTVFKALEIRGSTIDDCKFYHPYILIEGAFQWWARFQRSRVQSFRRAIIVSCATREGISLDVVKAELTNSDYNYTTMSNFLVRASAGSVNNYDGWTTQCNDSFFAENYIAGATTVAVPASFLEIDSIDTDFAIERNWIEFLEYVVRPCLRRNTVSTSTQIYGTTFQNNEFQIIYRIFEEFTRWSGFRFIGNSFTSFRRASLQDRIPNAVNARWNTHKCGVVVVDQPAGDTTLIVALTFVDNAWRRLDHGVYIDTGTSTQTSEIYESGTRIQTGDTGVTTPFYLRGYKDPGSSATRFINTYIESLDRRVLETLPAVGDTNNHYIDMFNGQTTIVGEDVYISLIGATGRVIYKQLT